MSSPYNPFHIGKFAEVCTPFAATSTAMASTSPATMASTSAAVMHSASTIMSTATAAAGAAITAVPDKAAFIGPVALRKNLFGCSFITGTGTNGKATTTQIVGLPTSIPAGATLSTKIYEAPHARQALIKYKVIPTNTAFVGLKPAPKISPELVRKINAAYNKVFQHATIKGTFLEDRPVLLGMLVVALATAAVAGSVYAWDREFYKSLRQQYINDYCPPGVDAAAFRRRGGVLGKFLTQVTKANKAIKRELGVAAAYMIEVAEELPKKDELEIKVAAAQAKCMALIDAHGQEAAKDARRKKQGLARDADLEANLEVLEQAADLQYAQWKKLKAKYHREDAGNKTGFEKGLNIVRGLMGYKKRVHGYPGGHPNPKWSFSEPPVPKPAEEITEATVMAIINLAEEAATSPAKGTSEPVKTTDMVSPKAQPLVKLTKATKKIKATNSSTTTTKATEELQTPVTRRKRGRDENEEGVTAFTPKGILSDRHKRRKLTVALPSKKRTVTFDLPPPEDMPLKPGDLSDYIRSPNNFKIKEPKEVVQAAAPVQAPAPVLASPETPSLPRLRSAVAKISGKMTKWSPSLRKK